MLAYINIGVKFFASVVLCQTQALNRSAQSGEEIRREEISEEI